MSSQFRNYIVSPLNKVDALSDQQLCPLIVILLLVSVLSSACASPQVEAFGPTPIPTLAPVTVVPGPVEVEITPDILIESFPAGLPSAENGQRLYAEHCANCHGVDGYGQVPNARNFGDVDYMRGETPLDFYLAITEGVTTIEEYEDQMPAFGEMLSSDERWDLAYYVWRFATTTERLAVGDQIYTSFCEECHGQDGRSQILNAADLSDQRFIAHLSPSDLYLSVTRGRGSMPAWQARLSQDERWMVVEYLRTFSYDPRLSETTTIIEESELEGNEDQLSCDPVYLSQTNPFDWSDSDAIAAGEPIYLKECSDCHGEDGSGQISQVRDFTNPAVNAELLEKSSAFLCRIAEGINRMPSFKDNLTDTEMWQLLTYIASLGE